MKLRRWLLKLYLTDLNATSFRELDRWRICLRLNLIMCMNILFYSYWRIILKNLVLSLVVESCQEDREHIISTSIIQSEVLYKASTSSQILVLYCFFFFLSHFTLQGGSEGRKKKIAQFQNIFLRCPLCVNIYEQHFSQIGEEKKNARYAEHVYIEPQIKNDESTRCQVTPGTDNEDEPKKISPFGAKKK